MENEIILNLLEEIDTKLKLIKYCDLPKPIIIRGLMLILNVIDGLLK